jgi:putative nucleotidyltransferase with HDIG domain
MAQKLDYDDVKRVFPELGEIKDSRLRTVVAQIWTETAAEMSWASLEEIPKNTTGESGRNLVDHIRGVTQMAMQICEIAKTLHGKPYDRDVMVAAGLLHDVSKLVEYEPDPDKPGDNKLPRAGRQSRIGKNIQHGVYAAHKMLAKGLSPELVHLVITHTHASNKRGKTWEAAALFYADFADSDAGLSTAHGKMFSERWTLGHD